MAMALEQSDIEKIGEWVRTQLPDWLESLQYTPQPDRMADSEPGSRDPVRSEQAPGPRTPQIEYTEWQNEVTGYLAGMAARFDASDKRFEELIHHMDKRFDQVDKRFEELLHYMDKRFDQVDKRFEELIHHMDKRFEDQTHYMDKRFDQVDKRFEELILHMDKRFEDQTHYMDKRFEGMNKRFSSLQWLITAGFVAMATLLSVYQFLG
jgi:hypothetical protein